MSLLAMPADPTMGKQERGAREPLRQMAGEGMAWPPSCEAQHAALSRQVEHVRPLRPIACRKIVTPHPPSALVEPYRLRESLSGLKPYRSAAQRPSGFSRSAEELSPYPKPAGARVNIEAREESHLRITHVQGGDSCHPSRMLRHVGDLLRLIMQAKLRNVGIQPVHVRLDAIRAQDRKNEGRSNRVVCWHGTADDYL